MEGRSLLRRKDREALRERWLLRAGQAFERMFAEANQDGLVTFTEREDMACLLGRAIGVGRDIGVSQIAQCQVTKGRRGDRSAVQLAI